LNDLDYHEVLNYQNISMILIGTFIVSVILSKYPQESKIITIFLSVLLIIYVRSIYHKQMEQIKNKIRELR
jgi:c-di-AMP phosphodiesterase-like protein